MEIETTFDHPSKLLRPVHFHIYFVDDVLTFSRTPCRKGSIDPNVFRWIGASVKRVVFDNLKEKDIEDIICCLPVNDGVFIEKFEWNNSKFTSSTFSKALSDWINPNKVRYLVISNSCNYLEDFISGFKDSTSLEGLRLDGLNNDILWVIPPDVNKTLVISRCSSFNIKPIPSKGLRKI